MEETPTIRLVPHTGPYLCQRAQTMDLWDLFLVQSSITRTSSEIANFLRRIGANESAIKFAEMGEYEIGETAASLYSAQCVDKNSTTCRNCFDWNGFVCTRPGNAYSRIVLCLALGYFAEGTIPAHKSALLDLMIAKCESRKENPAAKAYMLCLQIIKELPCDISSVAEIEEDELNDFIDGLISK